MKTQRTKAHEYRVLKEMNSNNAISVLAPPLIVSIRSSTTKTAASVMNCRRSILAS